MIKRLFAFLLTLVLVFGLGAVAHAGGGSGGDPNPPIIPVSIPIEVPPIEYPCDEDYCNGDEQ